MDLESISDPVFREAAKSQVLNFGQTPSQIFTKEHPKRMPSCECYIPLCSQEETLEDLEIFKCADNNHSNNHSNNYNHNNLSHNRSISLTSDNDGGAIVNILESNEKIILVDEYYNIKQFHWDSFPLSGVYIYIYLYIYI